MLPTDLKARAQSLARRTGISLGELIRISLAATLRGDAGEIRDDPLFADDAVYREAAPSDLTDRHDDYLYSEES